MNTWLIHHMDLKTSSTSTFSHSLIASGSGSSSESSDLALNCQSFRFFAEIPVAPAARLLCNTFKLSTTSGAVGGRH